MRFSISISRFAPFIGYHHVLMILIVIAIILLSLLLAGCSSSSPVIPNIFLISLFYTPYTPTPSTAQTNFGVHSSIQQIVGHAQLEARVGFFGICINPDGGAWLCSNNATSLANQISIDQDPLNLIWLASQFKDMIVFPYLIRDRRRIRTRRQALPLATRLPGLASNHLHRLDLRACLGTVAAHGFGGREYHSAGPGEWKRQERGGGYGYGAGLVWLRVADYCDDWTAGYDTEYPGAARFGGLMGWT
ncbi:hypothetical protein V494_08209 [Pseudogymnoascus sp. VKM F-4513 (FW-928)]|nr:hypothetical protein V494_08209 [Pseudogymnoascus sp. VKM F-4513 (FW-928)]